MSKKELLNVGEFVYSADLIIFKFEVASFYQRHLYQFICHFQFGFVRGMLQFFFEDVRFTSA